MTPMQTPRGQILTTDDDADLRWVLGYTPGALGFGVMSSANGKQALLELGTRRLDAVLLDVNMPELAARLRSAVRRSNTEPGDPDERRNPPIVNGDIELEPNRRTVRKGDLQLRLTTNRIRTPALPDETSGPATRTRFISSSIQISRFRGRRQFTQPRRGRKLGVWAAVGSHQGSIARCHCQDTRLSAL